MNKQAAKEWLEKAWHNLGAAKILYDTNHYTDITAVELHYAVEKILKSFLAYENNKIIKSHDLFNIYELVSIWISLKDYRNLLDKITKYYIAESYPICDRALPSREEIKEVLDFAKELFEQVCGILDIKLEEVKL